MVDRCNAVGVRIFVDGIINHMCGEDALTGTGTGGSSYDTDNLKNNQHEIINFKALSIFNLAQSYFK